ncbi:helix-turn-helix transcriptional regulator [Longispora urticae]
MGGGVGQRPKELTPHLGPRHFWGSELRQWRLHRGWSQAGVARVVHLSAGQVAKLEDASRLITADVAARCDQALDAGGALIRAFALVDVGHDGDVSNPADDVSNPGDAIAVQKVRHALLEPFLMVVPARVAGGRFVHVQAHPTDDPPLKKNRHGEILMPLQHYKTNRLFLAESDNRFGPRHLIGLTLEEINRIQDTRKSFGTSALRDWFSILAEYADLLGWFLQDTGEHSAAQYWLDRALEWTHMTGNPDATAFILARKAQLSGDMHDGTEAVELAEAAMRTAPPRSRMAAIAATYAGHGYAILGQADESERYYDRAQSLLAEAEPDDSPFGAYFNPTYIKINRAQSRTLLGDFQFATVAFDAALRQLTPDYRRDQGVYLAREARACAGDSEAERAATLGMQALIIGVDTGSRRALTELTELQYALAPWQTNNLVRDFLDAMTALAQPTEYR